MFNNENNNCPYEKCGDDRNVRNALEKIRIDSQFKPNCCCGGITGPTGPAGGPTGPTHTLLSESKWYFLTIFLI